MKHSNGYQGTEHKEHTWLGGGGQGVRQLGKQVITILNDTGYNRAKCGVLKEHKERASLVFRDQRKGDTGYI